MSTPTGYGHRTYRAYMPHTLDGWNPVLDAEAVNAVTEANSALAEISSQAETLLGTVLADWMMARDESIRSSVMEGVTATTEGLAWAQYMDRMGQPVSDENDALTLGAAKQVRAAVALGGRMRSGEACTADDIRGIHRALFEGTRDRSIGGEMRDGPIWVGPAGCLIDQASFVAPPKEMVPDLLDDLVAYLNSATHPGVLQAAAVHAQFETIHPFDDGNGRTGRALIHTVLTARGLARGAVPISAALSGDRARYYDALDATRVVCDSDDSTSRSTSLREWLTLFCEACITAEREATAVAMSIEAMDADWQKQTSFRSGSAASALLKALPAMPVLDAAMAAERLGITHKAARSALGALARAQIVSPVGGRRNRRYTVPGLVGMLRGMGPDGAQAHREAVGPVVGISVPARVACAHLGVRSRKHCVLPKGHFGQHRYRVG